MRYLVAFTTVGNPHTQVIEFSGLLPIDETRLPLKVKASSPEGLLTIEDVDQLIVIDQGVAVPHDGKKLPEIELITYIGDRRQTVFARSYCSDMDTKIPTVRGVTVHGHNFTVYNCHYVPLTIH